jgi:hypothetical protein
MLRTKRHGFILSTAWGGTMSTKVRPSEIFSFYVLVPRISFLNQLAPHSNLSTIDSVINAKPGEAPAQVQTDLEQEETVQEAHSAKSDVSLSHSRLKATRTIPHWHPSSQRQPAQTRNTSVTAITTYVQVSIMACRTAFKT